MSRHVSPLRYPGGKARMTPALANLFATQAGPMDIEVWVEPFAGGAGAGLTLLAGCHVEQVWLIEAHPALAAFWQTVTGPDAEHLATRVETTQADMELWARSREVVAAAEAGEQVGALEAAFAAFVVNRCSRSGIATASAGPIGGKHQTGKWGVAARFNGPALASRLRQVATLAAGGRIRVIHGDGIDHIEQLTGSGIEDELFVFADPPYIAQGPRLYTHGLNAGDHERLASALTGCPSHWLLTYDAHPDVLELYPSNRVLAYQIPHTANRQRLGWEYAVLSDNLWVRADLTLLPKGQTRWEHKHSNRTVAVA